MLILQTERLLLREFNTGDADFILELLNTPEWIANIGDKGIKSIDDATAYLLNGPIESYKKNRFGLWAVVKKDSGELIGMCGLIKRDTLDSPDIGYALLPQFTGNGYAYEVAAATLKYGFEICNMQRVVAITTQENTRSVSLLQKLGFEFEKKIRFSADTEELLLYSIREDNRKGSY